MYLIAWKRRVAGGWPVVILIASAAVIELGCLRLTAFDAVNGARPVAEFLVTIALLFVAYAFACWSTKFVGARVAFAIVVGGAILFRLTLIPAGISAGMSYREKLITTANDLSGGIAYEPFLLYDNDVWRFLWEGHLQASGVNPYLAAPEDPALDWLAGDPGWSRIRDRVNHASYVTIYPPVAIELFRLSHLLAPGSVAMLKLLLILCELGAIGFIAAALDALGRARREVVFYAWNPLALKVFAGSAHFDALVVLFLAMTAYFVVKRQRGAAGIGLALAALTKWFPLVAFPLLFRRVGVRAIVPAIVLSTLIALPMAREWRGASRGLAVFAAEWDFNAGPFALAQWLTGSRQVAALIMGSIVLAVLFVMRRRDDGTPESFLAAASWTMGLGLVVAPVVMPWYVTWFLPFALLANQRVWFLFSGLVFIAFIVMVDGRQHVVPIVIEYGILALALAYSRFERGKPFLLVRQEVSSTST